MEPSKSMALSRVYGLASSVSLGADPAVAAATTPYPDYEPSRIVIVIPKGTYHPHYHPERRASSTLSFRTERIIHIVILNEAERSEESKIVAHKPFADFRFLALLEITGA